MIEKTEAYDRAITGDARRIYIKADVNISSPDLKYGEIEEETLFKYADPSQILDGIKTNGKDFTALEHNMWVLDGSKSLYPADETDSRVTENENGDITDNYIVGYESIDSGSIGDPKSSDSQYISINISGVTILQMATFIFADNDDYGIPEDFTIEILSGGLVIETITHVMNTSRLIVSQNSTVRYPDEIRITVTKMSIPFRRVRLIEFYPGLQETWDADIIGGLSIRQESDFSNVTIPYGTCQIKMDNLDRRFEPRNKNGIFNSIEERQSIPVALGVQLEDGTIDYTNIGVFYQSSGGWKMSTNGMVMQWDLVDIIGLLAQRKYIVPKTKYTKLKEWVDDLLGQLGDIFVGKIERNPARYHIDPDYENAEVTVYDLSHLENMTGGDVLRYLCMATGLFPRADSQTGYLTLEPQWNQGKKVDLDNLVDYPTMTANDDLAFISFNVYTSSTGRSTFNVSGNNSASTNTVSVDNPFIRSTEQATKAARAILEQYGGNTIELNGRGNMASEIGDIDTIEVSDSAAVAARRRSQSFTFTDGVMKNVPSTLLQPTGVFLFSEYVTFIDDGEYTLPDGVTKIYIVLGGGGQGGGNGGRGSYTSAGSDGAAGAGGKIYSTQLDVNEHQVLRFTIGQGGSSGGKEGTDTVLYLGEQEIASSADGRIYSPSYTDIATGVTYGRTGTKKPAKGTSDGGAGGEGGRMGRSHQETVQTAAGSVTYDVIDSKPGGGSSGASGASGFVLISWDIPEGA